MLLIIYQIFNSLLGNLPFSVQFFLHFYGVTFFGTPNTHKRAKSSNLSEGQTVSLSYLSTISLLSCQYSWYETLYELT